MFQALIDQAYDMVQRLYACAEKGRNEVPLSVAIRYSEFEAWETTAFGIINTIFGTSSNEVARWRALAERRGMLLADARRNDIKRGEFLGLIDYFNLAAGVLREFEAAYQHEQAAAQAAANPPPETSNGAAAQSSADLATLQPQEQPSEPFGSRPVEVEEVDEPPVVRRVAANQWDVIVSFDNELYTWLSDAAATREPASADGGAVARLVATIIERVALQTQRSRARGQDH